MSDAARDHDDPINCRFCPSEPSDWCPACGALLCDFHSRWHRGSFEVRCTQEGPTLDFGWVEHAITLDADTLDRAGVAIGHLGLTNNGHRSVSVHRCPDCRRVFTVTGPASTDFGNGCLADDCASYDLARDVDIFFESAMEAGIIRREENP